MPSPFTSRLTTRVTAPVRARLDLTKAATGEDIDELCDRALDAHLPDEQQLTELAQARMRGQA